MSRKLISRHPCNPCINMVYFITISFRTVGRSCISILSEPRNVLEDPWTEKREDFTWPPHDTSCYLLHLLVILSKNLGLTNGSSTQLCEPESREDITILRHTRELYLISKVIIQAIDELFHLRYPYNIHQAIRSDSPFLKNHKLFVEEAR